MSSSPGHKRTADALDSSENQQLEQRIQSPTLKRRRTVSFHLSFIDKETIKKKDPKRITKSDPVESTENDIK